MKTYCKKEPIDMADPKFKSYKEECIEKLKKEKNCFNDPDHFSNNEFYDNLTTFLNKQENKMKNDLEGEFEYTFKKDEGIEVTDKNGNKLFDLKSDQLGFSRPFIEKNSKYYYPWTLYIRKSKDKDEDEARKNVVDWIAKARTIGSSFLWPKSCWDKEHNYNSNRGGGIYKKHLKNYYIQDRVDLTLWEIKYWFDFYNKKDPNNNYEKTKMSECESDDLSTWLSHFKNFETYVNFFCFNDFLDENYEPKCIINTKNKASVDNKIREITTDLDKQIIEHMLSDVSDWIEKRSESMENIINGEAVVKIYCMSDIHGYYYEFEEALSLIEDKLKNKDTMLCLLGDYIHYGEDSYKVLDKIMSLQDKYGNDRVVALMGNHEDFVLSGYCLISDKEKYINGDDDKYIDWISNLPTHYSLGNTIFVHAGIDEEAGEDWEWGTSDEIFVGKYPADIGKIEGLDMKVVAGHVGTHSLAGDPNYHDIYYDGASHYYVDGTVKDSGVIPVLLVDTTKDKYYSVDSNGIEEIQKYGIDN